MLLSTVRRHYTEAKAQLSGKAISRARLIPQLRDVAPKLRTQGAATPTNHVLRDSRGRKQRYWSDGSLRNER